MIRLGILDALLLGSTPNHPARLVSRPRGVAHVYAGRMTPGGAVPRRSRPVCGASTKRLYDCTPPVARLVCARCSARLRALRAGGRAEQSHRLKTKADDLRHYRGLSVVDIYLSAQFAVSLDELDECALALTLGHSNADAAAAYTSPSGREFSKLPQWIDLRRSTVLNDRRIEAIRKVFRSDPAYQNAVTQTNIQRVRQTRRQYV